MGFSAPALTSPFNDDADNVPVPARVPVPD